MTTPGAENFDRVMLARHMANLRRMGHRMMREGYYRDVAYRDGQEYADMLRAEFDADMRRRAVAERQEGI